MAKTVPPGTISLPGGDTFVANAVPDPFDERDLEYRPRLEPLPPRLDQRVGRIVLTQKGESCTGHAVATVINTVLGRAALAAAAPDLPRVSPYMIYRLARRYDEFAGEADEGSSLRGAFKGWFNHGAALEADWPDLEMDPEPDLDDPAFVARCRDRPLGAFYRVNPYRLDDMQSAISELQVIAVSAVIHDGWNAPERLERDGQELCVIARGIDARALGGHAFALVGYNEVGFLVQNSWGEAWGKNGFATLPYEDWLDSAYDAWVARPGVPKTPFATGRNQAAPATSGALATGPGPDLKRLARHVVNLENDGKLSPSGKFVSTPRQINRIFEHMARWHDCWEEQKLADRRHVVIWAHDGLAGEADGLAIAQKHLNWWLNNGVYPLYFAWQSGPAEVLIDQLADMLRKRLPPGGIGFDLVEQFDRLVEKIARSSARWMWDEMKATARAASLPIKNEEEGQAPGASLVVRRLKNYVEQHGAGRVAVHLVGHGAGSIFLAALLPRLAEAGISVESLSLLAPASRVDDWTREILPHLGPEGIVARFATFALKDARERDDRVGVRGVTFYHKSLLYLVSRALERPTNGDGGETPLLGMEKFFDRPAPGDPQSRTLRQIIEAMGGTVVFSRADAPEDSRSDAAAHGDFDDDSPTMTSVVMRVRGVEDAKLVEGYQPNAALRPIHCSSLLGEPAAPETAGEPATTAAATHPPGEEPVVETAEPQAGRPTAPAPGDQPVVEVAVAPRTGSPILDLLRHEGWRNSGR